MTYAPPVSQYGGMWGAMMVGGEGGGKGCAALAEGAHVCTPATKRRATRGREKIPVPLEIPR